MLRKVILCTTLAITLIAGTITFAEGDLSNFRQQKTYSMTTFKDVSLADWYYGATKSAFEFGLMGGKSQGVFDPMGNLTLAEAVAIASRVHNVYNGGDGVIVNTGSNWYDGAVSYAIKNGIIKVTDFNDYTKLASRAQMAYIFASTLQTKDYTAINNITKLPDVSSSTLYSDYIFKLYNAGIIGGSDKMGTFKPSSNITRAETVAILKNLVVKTERKVLSLSVPTSGGMLVSKERVKSLATSVVGYDATFESASKDYTYQKYTKDQWGQQLYHQIPKIATAIQTKYGEHTYGCYDQTTYDYVMQKIEEGKSKHNVNTYDFAGDFKWQAYYAYKAGSTEPDTVQIATRWTFRPIIEQFGEAKAKELYIQMGITGRIILDTMTIVDIIGESAYEQLTTGADCNGRAHLDSAIFDSFGYSTRILGDATHAWTQVKLSDGKWYDVSGLTLGNQTTNTSSSKGTCVIVHPTY